MKKALLSAIFLLYITLTGLAQFVNFGQDPASLRWKQINTTDFQIIYPDFFEKNAQKVANIYHQLYNHSNTLKHKPRKMSIILHADGGIANGNVGWAPQKSELYTMPQQEPTDNWLEQLCVHEFRHVIQIDKVNQGTTEFLYHIFGDIFPIAVVGIFLPMWFMEGDAVCFETALGHIGRGRSPEFLNEMKAQLVEKKLYIMQKAVLGSLKDHVPDRYMMGYYLTANSYANYGPEIWEKAINRVGRRPFGIVPFSRSLSLTMREKRDSLWNTPSFRTLFSNPDSVKQANTKKNGQRMLYMDNFAELKQIWTKEAHAITDHFDTIPTHNKYYANYYHPVPIPGGGIIVYKKGMQQTGAFVLLEEGKETVLVNTGNLYDYSFSVHDSMIVWSEYRPDLRWELGGRMVLCSYDIRLKSYKRHKSRYNRFAPFTTDTGWGCVEVDHQNQASIILLDHDLKHDLSKFEAGKEELFIHPSYYAGKINTVVQTTAGIHLESIDLQHGTRTIIHETATAEMDHPVQSDSLLFFRASFNGNNALYRKDLKNNHTVNALNAPFGIQFPSIDASGDSLYFSFYTSDGYKPGKIKTSELYDRPIEMNSFRLADTMRKLENWTLKFQADSVFQTKRYSKFTHLPNIHSWGPISFDLDDLELNFGVVVYSQNKLSTLSFMAGYVWKTDYDHGAWMLNASYRGWWPIIDLNLETGRYDDQVITKATNILTNTLENIYSQNKSRLSSADVTVSFPFNLTIKNYNRSFKPYVRYEMAAIHDSEAQNIYRIISQNNTYYLESAIKEDYRFTLPARYYQILEYGASFSNQIWMTDQGLYPRWGQTLRGGYSHTPLENIKLGAQWWISGQFYFPGLFKNHSLNAYAGYQHMLAHERNYSNKIRSPKGITLYGHDLSTLSFSYYFPILYPDLRITGLLYMSSIDAGMFFDTGNSTNIWGKQQYHSYGVEAFSDVHLFRITVPIRVGFRTGYETQQKAMFTNFMLSVGLSI